MEKNRIYIVTFKGKEILYGDHRGLRDKELLNNVKAAFKFCDEYKKGEFLSLTNWSNTFGTNELMGYIKSQEVKNITKNMKKAAIVGVIGVQKIFLNAYNKIIGGKTRAFNTEEEAKEWLVKD